MTAVWSFVAGVVVGAVALYLVSKNNKTVQL